MVKPRKITLIVMMLVVVLGGQAVRAQDPLTEHFVSADGTLEFKYPADWVVQEALGSVVLSNTSQAFDDEGTSVVPGTIFAVLFVESLEGALPPQAEKTLWSAMEHTLQEAQAAENAPAFGDVVELPIGGRPSLHSRGVSDTQDALILVLDLGEGYFGELSAVTAPGELALFQEMLLAILTSIQFTPPPPPVIAGSMVWQRTGAIGEQGGPDDFLVGLAIGPDDRIYTADSDTIFVFEPDGSGPRIIENEALSAIRDLAVTAEGKIWVISNLTQQVMLLDADGTLIRSWGEAGQAEGQFGFLSPLQIEIGPDGNLYILDTNTDADGQPITRIQVWSSTGEYLRTLRVWVYRDLLTGEIRMAFGPDGQLYVLDMNVLYQMDGKLHISESIATGRLSLPGNFGLTLALDSNGLIYIATAAGAILQQDTAGAYYQQFGTLQVYPDDATGDPPFAAGEFAHPEGLGVLSNGDVAVVDANFDYWQVVRISFAAEGS